MVSSQVESIEIFADFIMATDIGWSTLAYLTFISHQAFSLISVLDLITCAYKQCCLNSFCYKLNLIFFFFILSPLVILMYWPLFPPFY